MSKYIDADLLRAEIERRMFEDYDGPDIEQNETAQGVCAGLLAFLDTLPEQPVEKTSYDTQKYTPSSSVSIEDVARVQFASHAKVFDKKRKAVFDWEQFKEVAGIFYGFGKKDSPETKEKEQPVEGLDVTDFCKPVDPGTAKCIADHWWEMIGEESTNTKPVEGLEEEMEIEAERFVKTLPWRTNTPPMPDEYIDWSTLKTIARHFAEWGAEHLKR